VLRDQAFATLALDGELSRLDLSTRERGLATELTYGVLRHQSRLDRALLAAATKGLKVAPAILVALRVAAYQLIFLDRVPAHAAVDDAVRAVKRTAGPRMAGFANGLLRRLAKDGEPALPKAGTPLDQVELEHSLPRWIAEELAAQVGEDDLVAASAGFCQSAGLALRANRLRIHRDELRARLLAEKEDADVIASAHASEGLHARGLGSPDRSPSFQAGLWSVQDIGAQMVGELAAPAKGMRVLDACAGVGGKSTHLAELMDDEGEVWAVDVSERKLGLLADSKRRLGLASIQSRVADLTSVDSLAGEQFDIVVLDAPCSGLGVLRRHPEAKWRMTPSDLPVLRSTQERLLDQMAACVRPGGHLVYSVCTFTSAEGPEQAAAFLGRHPVFTAAAEQRTWPHQHLADGFFASKFVRNKW